jgi:dihydrofolate reductase
MENDSFNVTIHMVTSLDGMIAKRDNSISWFETTSLYEKGVNVQGAEEFLKTIDCYIMGSRTYEHAIELSKTYGWPYGETNTIVVSNRNLPINRKNIELYAGDLNKLVNDILKPKYKNVWLAGGAMLAKEFIRLKLANEIRLSIIPIILGDGVPFFNHIGTEQEVHLKDVLAYKNGIVELCYEINNI